MLMMQLVPCVGAGAGNYWQGHPSGDKDTIPTRPYFCGWPRPQDVPEYITSKPSNLEPREVHGCGPSSISWIRKVHEPQPPPARQATVTCSTVRSLPSAITLSTVSSDTPKQVQISARSPRNSLTLSRRTSANAARRAPMHVSTHRIRPSGNLIRSENTTVLSSEGSSPCRSARCFPSTYPASTPAAPRKNPQPFEVKPAFSTNPASLS